MDDVASASIYLLSQADQAYVAARARCMLWHAWIEETEGVLIWDLSYIDPDSAHNFMPVAKEPGETLAAALYRARHPEDRQRTDVSSWAAIRENRNYSQDFRCTLADGTERWLHEDAAVETAGAGRWRVVGVVTDISELKIREGLFQQLADSIAQIAWMQAPDGKIEYLNRQYYELTGTDRFEGAEKAWSTVVHPADAERMRQTYRTAFAAGTNWEAEIRIRMKDDRYRWYLSQLVPLRDDQGRIVRWFGTATDVHAQKAVEEELERRVQERTKELVHAYDEMEAFNYSVSHDLRAPARAIHFACSVLLEEHGPELGRDARQELKRAMDAASRMGRLIDDLLQYSRLHRREVVRSRVDLSTIAYLVIEDLGGTEDVAITIQPGMVVDADAGLVRLVLQNLIENALKFSRPVTGAAIDFGATGRAFFVRDTGVGFDPTYAEKLFQPFQRLHRSDEFPGTGIGLANVRRIVERHGGRVWAEGAVGRGATFWFTLG
ncbi:MAG: sensor histidine kinase [Fimbriimonas sp.]